MADYLPGGDQSNLSSHQTHQQSHNIENAFPKSSADVLHVKESLLPNKLGSGEDGGAVSGLEDSDNETNPATNEPPDDLLQILNM